jgi:hypothetical protein
VLYRLVRAPDRSSETILASCPTSCWRVCESLDFDPYRLGLRRTSLPRGNCFTMAPLYPGSGVEKRYPYPSPQYVQPTRDSMTQEGGFLEAWAQGYNVGSLIILLLIVFCNYRSGQWLHKFIVLEVSPYIPSHLHRTIQLPVHIVQPPIQLSNRLPSHPPPLTNPACPRPLARHLHIHP